MSKTNPAEDAAIGCPVCNRPRDERYRPFCSRRCADRDLHKWLAGGYVIAAAPGDDEADEPSDPDTSA